MKIVALDGHTLNPGDNPWTPVEALGDFAVYDKTPDDQILARAEGATVILTNKVPLAADVFVQQVQLPRGETGKILKRKIRDHFNRRQAAATAWVGAVGRQALREPLCSMRCRISPAISH